jgi:DNA-binding transcriptional MerR regulator
MNNELFSLGDVARLVGVKPHRIQYLLSTAAVAEPALRVAGKRLWSAEEVAALSEVLAADKGERARGSDG